MNNEKCACKIIIDTSHLDQLTRDVLDNLIDKNNRLTDKAMELEAMLWDLEKLLSPISDAHALCIEIIGFVQDNYQNILEDRND